MFGTILVGVGTLAPDMNGIRSLIGDDKTDFGGVTVFERSISRNRIVSSRPRCL